MDNYYYSVGLFLCPKSAAFSRADFSDPGRYPHAFPKRTAILLVAEALVFANISTHAPGFGQVSAAISLRASGVVFSKTYVQLR
jgi:hypothetical protein